MTPTQEAALLKAVEAEATVIEKIVATVTVDIGSPLNLLNFAADLALWAEIKQAYQDAKTIVADIKQVV